MYNNNNKMGGCAMKAKLDTYAIAYVDGLAARVAELERDLEQAKEDRNRAAMDARNPLLARVAEMEARIKTITDGFRHEQNDIEQTCGKVLGYPRYYDDQKNFPGATEKDGVCVGEHVASSIAAELANKYRDLLARNKRLEEALNNVELVMQRPASNHRMMQIAEPARRVLNIIKQVKEYKQ